MTKLTKNGVSTTTEKDQFQMERYYCSITRSYRYSWDYRDSQGVLHSGTTKTEEAALIAARGYGYKG